ncbi:Gfo/Idh/MocA family protein [Methylovirgula sp. 4M-Z18]|uniref:Gfo/Idh/MocA family protein n=1 Tax=Methylovirgula sp. 4M-Z18 TaxID=2293567 RepID=UPI000E2F78E0|nr:Gfo/Idh/MocA family oxidoreductase [Methylovirgula sp. 4M-Z18]RFB76513.1 gfo/Idh/MocA family oxidoreductase [Methylovirgula sp. 4M-Z18]
MTTICFGIIGAGVAAETHARELRNVAGARLVSVFARNKEKAAAFAAAFSVPKSSDDLQEFLANAALDAVIVTTPNGVHMEYAVAAAKAGKHVVVEKPLEITSGRAQNIVDACNSSRVGLSVIYHRVHSRAARQAELDVQNGALGRIFLMNIVDNQFRVPAYYQGDAWRGTRATEGGGCVITQSTHMIDLVQFLLGPIASVYAATNTVLHDIETEDAAVAVFHFRSGVLGTFSSSTAAFPGQRHLLSIHGTKGTIIINGEHDEILFRQTADEGETHATPVGFSFRDVQNPRDFPTLGQRRQLQSIVNDLRDGILPNDGARALTSVQVVEAIYRSAAEMRPILL